MNSEGYNLKLNSKHPSLSHTSHCIVRSLYYIFKRLKKFLNLDMIRRFENLMDDVLNKGLG